MKCLQEQPSPGSKEAVERGCACPVLDNCKGKGVMGTEDDPQFWISEGCPLHAEDETK